MQLGKTNVGSNLPDIIESTNETRPNASSSVKSSDQVPAERPKLDHEAIVRRYHEWYTQCMVNCSKRTYIINELRKRFANAASNNNERAPAVSTKEQQLFSSEPERSSGKLY